MAVAVAVAYMAAVRGSMRSVQHKQRRQRGQRIS